MDDYGRYPDPTFTSTSLDLNMSGDAFFPRVTNQAHDMYAPNVAYESSLYADAASNYILTPHGSHANSRESPGMYPDDGDVRLGSSTLSTTSAPSAASSTIGSPQSHHGQSLGSMADWGTAVSMASMQPAIVSHDYLSGSDYSAFGSTGMDDFTLDFAGNKTFVGKSATCGPFLASFRPSHSSLLSASPPLTPGSLRGSWCCKARVPRSQPSRESLPRNHPSWPPSLCAATVLPPSGQGSWPAGVVGRPLGDAACADAV